MENLSFEEAVEELEKTVSELENDQLTLEESVKRFERGMELSKYCNDKLEEAQKSITVLIENANGEITEEPFVYTNEEE